ncbi:hypothetical protein D3C81_2012170 [compost metagenome]
MLRAEAEAVMPRPAARAVAVSRDSVLLEVLIGRAPGWWAGARGEAMVQRSYSTNPRREFKFS